MFGWFPWREFGKKRNDPIVNIKQSLSRRETDRSCAVKLFVTEYKMWTSSAA